MKTAPLFCILFFCVILIYAQKDQEISIGKIESIHSEILNEERELWIHVPDGMSNGMFEKTNYPVVYLLDGDAHFYSVVGMIQQLSAVNGNKLCPKMIVVGIPNTNRTRDLTSTKGNIEHPFVDSTRAAHSGGGEKFISFLENELIPYIDKKYPTEPYRMLIGHSFGGLTVINTLVHHPELFNSYVSIDPSMWWSDMQLLNEIKNINFDENYARKSLFIGIANTMPAGMDISIGRSDDTFDTEHIRAILELDELLSSDSQKHLHYKGKYYRDDDHSSAVLITEYDALRFIFDFYLLKLEDEDFNNPDVNLLDKVKKHYERLAEEFGTDAKPDEEFVNELGYGLLSRELFDKAEEFFKLNCSNYPTSFNVFDSLGDFYAETGNKRKAIKAYKRSLELNKDSYSKEKLEALQK